MGASQMRSDDNSTNDTFLELGYKGNEKYIQQHRTI